MNKNDTEDCHRLEKGEPKITTVQFVIHKFCNEALDKQFNLREVDCIELGFQVEAILYFSENLTPYNQWLAWKCRELKRAGKIHSSWSSKGIVQGSKNLIFVCTDFHACKMVLHARSCLQNDECIKQ